MSTANVDEKLVVVEATTEMCTTAATLIPKDITTTTTTEIITTTATVDVTPIETAIEATDETDDTNDESELSMLELVVDEDEEAMEDPIPCEPNVVKEQCELKAEILAKDLEQAVEQTAPTPPIEQTIEQSTVQIEIEEIVNVNEKHGEITQPQTQIEEVAELAKEIPDISTTIIAPPTTPIITIAPIKKDAANESEEPTTSTSKIRVSLIRGRKSIKELKDAIKEELNNKLKEYEENQEAANERKASTSGLTLKLKTLPLKDDKKAVEEPQELKDICKKESAAMSGDESTPTSRLKRKPVATELVVNTRITRNRQNSSGSLGRPETPPTNYLIATRRSIATRKTAANAMDRSPTPVNVKRKRYAEEGAHNELVSKHIKTEIKEDADLDEDENLHCDMESEIPKIKQEFSDGSENALDNNLSIACTVRGRPRGRKSQTPTTAGTAVSPSTRTTRLTKLTSQSPTTVGDAKRRRMMASSLKRSIKLNENKNVSQAADDDSKDSSDDTSHDIKAIKHTQESATDEESACEESEAITDIVLTIDTTKLEKNGEILKCAEELATSSSAQVLEKDSSLSPDIVSEGVNVMSVKQFYKKAEFLENNLGIEEDPKLGKIVQKVSNLTEEEQDLDEQHREQEQKVLELMEESCTSHVQDDVNKDDEEYDDLCGKLVIQDDDDDTEDMRAVDAVKEENEALAKLKIQHNNNDNNKKTTNDCDNVEAKLKEEKKAVVVEEELKAVKNENQNGIDEEKSELKMEVEMRDMPTTRMVEDNKENVVQMQLEESSSTVAANVKKFKKQELFSKSQIEAQNMELHTSASNSKAKLQMHRDDEATTDSNSCTTGELDDDEESLLQKEKHLKTLGLLTHKAAEICRKAHTVVKRNGKHITSVATPAVAAAAATVTPTTEYTGTLKTVIKLNRNASSGSSNGSSVSGGRKQTSNKEATNMRRQPLKMTFQKGRGRGQGNADKCADTQSNSEDAYYTIQNEVGGNKNMFHIKMMLNDFFVLFIYRMKVGLRMV